jgi:hypothetical protein
LSEATNPHRFIHTLAFWQLTEIVDKVNNFTLNEVKGLPTTLRGLWTRTRMGKTVLGKILRGVYPERDFSLRFAPFRMTEAKGSE